MPLGPNNSFKPTPCRGVGHVLYATLARTRRPATGRLNSGVMRRLIVVAAVLAFLPSCASTGRHSIPHARCDISPTEWSLLAIAPEDHARLLSLADNPSTSDSEELYWFNNQFGNLLLCRSLRRNRGEERIFPASCFSERWAYELKNGSWELSDAYSFTWCHAAHNNSFKPTPHRGVGRVPTLR